MSETFITLELYLSCVFAVIENSPKTQFRITRWNSTLKARCSLSSNGNISAQNASNFLENPSFESVFRQLVNYGRNISVSGPYMNLNSLHLMLFFFSSHRATLSPLQPVTQQRWRPMARPRNVKRTKIRWLQCPRFLEMCKRRSCHLPENQRRARKLHFPRFLYFDWSVLTEAKRKLSKICQKVVTN